MNARRTAVLVRSAYGTVAVEWFIIIAILAILVTRAYLAATGYPQVGGRHLHIAHALWGGALMMLALITGWLFLGATPRIVAIVMGGIGFGLFLDEVGKFVTRNNDYFYGPAAEIMYILVVLILLISRIVRDVRKPTTAEALANAASIAAEGVSHGLPSRRRRQADELLAFAADNGGDETLVTHVRGLLAASADSPDRLMQWRSRAVRLVPGFLRSPRWVSIVGWGLAALSAVTIVAGTLSFYFHEGRRGDVDVYLELSRSHVATWILLISGVLTFLLTFPAMIARRRSTSLWPLRSLRLGALVFTLSNALVDFALEGFGALTNLALGLFALSVIGYHLSRAATSPTQQQALPRL